MLSQLQWRSVELSATSAPVGLEMLNAYDRSPSGWRMPSVAMGSECWALLRMPMREALRLQRQHGTVLAVTVQATDASGERQTFAAQLPALPEVQSAEYETLQTHELVQRRIHELSAAQLQLQIRQAALQGDWMQVEQLLTHLETLGRHEPWVAASIAFTRQLMRERDDQRMSKEMLYKSRKMQSRLSSTDEVLYSNRVQESEIPAFLRRKTVEGRRTQT